MSLLNRIGYKITHLSKFPKGNLIATMRNLAARGFVPNHIIDVGANKGRWSRDARAIFPDCGFTLIEPQIEMKTRLDRFCRGRANCQWLLGGAAEKNGSMTFTVCPDTVSSRFNVPARQAQRAGFTQREVPVFTLDHIVENYVKKVPDIVKIDAEGFEQRVLQGSQSLLGKTELVFLEAHMICDDDDPCSLIELTKVMSDFGYAPYDFTWFGKLPRYNGAIGLCEVAFAKKQGILRQTRSTRTTKNKAA